MNQQQQQEQEQEQDFNLINNQNYKSYIDMLMNQCTQMYLFFFLPYHMYPKYIPFPQGNN